MAFAGLSARRAARLEVASLLPEYQALHEASPLAISGRSGVADISSFRLEGVLQV